MRSDKIFDMIGSADEKYVADANKKRRVKPKILLIPAAAMVLTVAIVLGAFMMPMDRVPDYPDETTDTDEYKHPDFTPGLLYPSGTLTPYTVLAAKYPQMVKYPDDPNGNSAESSAWWASKRELKSDFRELDELPEDFIRSSILEFLSNTDEENPIYSPINVYMALAILAETTDGNSRAQLLDLLGAESIEDLRVTANAIFKANYSNDGAKATILASSIWLDSDITYKENTLKTIAENYYASSFSGQMGSKGYNDALRAWLNEQTGGLLTDQIENISMDPETVLTIATTVYFNAKWDNEFDEKKNDQRLFHGTSGDTLAEFMNSESYGDYYWGEKFSAAYKSFDLGGGDGMYFILPDENVSVYDLLADNEAMALILGKGTNKKHVKINLSLPKFDVSSNLDLTEGLKNLGVTDIFDPARSDFSALSDASELAVTKAEHASRVRIDEKGCAAAAYTIMHLCGAMAPEGVVDFVLDRPFIFVITSEVGLPLFVGVVNELG